MMCSKSISHFINLFFKPQRQVKYLTTFVAFYLFFCNNVKCQSIAIGEYLSFSECIRTEQEIKCLSEWGWTNVAPLRWPKNECFSSELDWIKFPFQWPLEIRANYAEKLSQKTQMEFWIRLVVSLSITIKERLVFK